MAFRWHCRKVKWGLGTTSAPPGRHTYRRPALVSKSILNSAWINRGAFSCDNSIAMWQPILSLSKAFGNDIDILATTSRLFECLTIASPIPSGKILTATARDALTKICSASGAHSRGYRAGAVWVMSLGSRGACSTWPDIEFSRTLSGERVMSVSSGAVPFRPVSRWRRQAHSEELTTSLMWTAHTFIFRQVESVT